MRKLYTSGTAHRPRIHQAHYTDPVCIQQEWGREVDVSSVVVAVTDMQLFKMHELVDERVYELIGSQMMDGGVNDWMNGCMNDG